MPIAISRRALSLFGLCGACIGFVLAALAVQNGNAPIAAINGLLAGINLAIFYIASQMRT